MAIPLLPPHPVAFPDPEQAELEPDGLLAAGGALTREWLVTAYANGIFPWFDDDDDYILWWSPSVRAVLTPGNMRVTRSLRKRFRNAGFEATMDTDFAAVIRACSQDRRDQHGTWITPQMQSAYCTLHEAGLAHSVEIWLHGALVGGLYGVSLGRFFFGESMFTREKDASKTAFYMLQKALERWSFRQIDCQMMTPHLASLGVTPLARTDFLANLAENPLSRTRQGKWRLPFDLASVA